MKKIITLFAFVGLLAFSACSSSDDFDEDNDTIPLVFEIESEDFVFNNVDGYNLSYTFQQWIGDDLYDDETVLIYRLEDVLNSGAPVWQLIPRTLYLDEGELDYDYNFSPIGFKIFAGGNYNLNLTPQYLNNQTFRVVIIPAVFATSLDTTNYNEVMNTLKLSENQVKKVKL
ncbi:hypothetical protein ABS764_16085 [Flavobacterium sp. ST-87]|uniref:Uncharacterized protein n=1 Tax=Flavobacterium plantiphilum TaxID=3163297 RepID=A0ABW8XXH7_9FLAO